ATVDEMERYEREDLQLVRDAQRRAWDAYRADTDADVRTVVGFLDRLGADALKSELQRNTAPYRRDAMRALTAAMVGKRADSSAFSDIAEWRGQFEADNARRYDDELYGQTALNVPVVPAEF